MYHPTDRIAHTKAFVKPVMEHWLEQEIPQSKAAFPLPPASMAQGARCSSMVRAFAHGAMGRQIDPSWDGPIELFLVPASIPRLV